MWSRRDLIDLLGSDSWYWNNGDHQSTLTSNHGTTTRPNPVISRPCLPLRPCRSPENVRNVSRQLSTLSECSKILESAKPGTWWFLTFLRLRSTQHAQNFDSVFSKMQNVKIIPLLVNLQNFFFGFENLKITQWKIFQKVASHTSTLLHKSRKSSLQTALEN